MPIAMHLEFTDRKLVAVSFDEDVGGHVVTSLKEALGGDVVIVCGAKKFGDYKHPSARIAKELSVRACALLCKYDIEEGARLKENLITVDSRRQSKVVLACAIVDDTDVDDLRHLEVAMKDGSKGGMYARAATKYREVKSGLMVHKPVEAGHGEYDAWSLAPGFSETTDKRMVLTNESFMSRFGCDMSYYSKPEDIVKSIPVKGHLDLAVWDIQSPGTYLGGELIVRDVGDGKFEHEFKGDAVKYVHLPNQFRKGRWDFDGGAYQVTELFGLRGLRKVLRITRLGTSPSPSVTSESSSASANGMVARAKAALAKRAEAEAEAKLKKNELIETIDAVLESIVKEVVRDVSPALPQSVEDIDLDILVKPVKVTVEERVKAVEKAVDIKAAEKPAEANAAEKPTTVPLCKGEEAAVLKTVSATVPSVVSKAQFMAVVAAKAARADSPQASRITIRRALMEDFQNVWKLWCTVECPNPNMEMVIEEIYLHMIMLKDEAYCSETRAAASAYSGQFENMNDPAKFGVGSMQAALQAWARKVRAKFSNILFDGVVSVVAKGNDVSGALAADGWVFGWVALIIYYLCVGGSTLVLLYFAGRVALWPVRQATGAVHVAIAGWSVKHAIVAVSEYISDVKHAVRASQK